MKEKMMKQVDKNRDIILVVLPLFIATIVVAFRLISPDVLGYYADAYTIAMLFTLSVISIGIYVTKR